MKQVIGLLLGFFGIIGVALSAISIQYTVIGFVVTVLLVLFGVISNGWWIIGVPLLMFFGGLLGLLINLSVTALGAALFD